jgi:hypothetical protein
MVGGMTAVPEARILMYAIPVIIVLAVVSLIITLCGAA